MTELEYLREYYNITETAIGMALLNFNNNEEDMAYFYLKESQKELDELLYEFFPEAKELKNG